MTEAQREQLAHGAAMWDLRLDDATLDRFARFAVLLEEGNQRQNLTRIAPEDLVTLHFLDSLALAAVCRPAPGDRLLDLGTGAGFPGLPLALAFPELHVTLLDATRKRLAFLDTVIAALELSHVHTRHGRAEALAPVSATNRYEIVTARAVAKLPLLTAWMLPLVKSGGLAVAYKSRAVEEEIGEARPVIARWGGRLERTAEVVIPHTEIVRKLLLIRKMRATTPLSSHRTP